MRAQVEKLIYNNVVFCAIIFIPFVEPLYFTQLVVVDTIYLYWKLIATGLIIFAWTLHGKLDKVLISFLFFLALDCLVTTVNKGNTTQMYINAMTLTAMATMFMTAAENGSYTFVKVASLTLETLILINFITIIVFPEGLYNFTSVNHHYFLGSRNVMMRTIFPGVGFSVLRSKIETNRVTIRTLLIMVTAGISLVLVWSATALFAYVAFCVFLFLFQIKGIPKWFTVKKCYLLALAVFLGIVVFRLQDIFSPIIVSILNKDTTFTGRTLLWDAGMLNIAGSPIFGYGLEHLETIAAKLYRFTDYDSCHNLFLDLLYQNGLLGVALIAPLFVSVAIKTDNKMEDKYRLLFTLIVFGYSIMINFEPFINGDMRLFVSFLFFIRSFDGDTMNKRTVSIRRKIYKFGAIRLN